MRARAAWLWSHLKRRDAHPAVQFVKYGLAGALATSVDVLIFSAAAIWLLPCVGPDDPLARLLGLHLPAVDEGLRSSRFVWDRTLAFLVANTAAYLVNALWVFTPGRHSRAKEFALFYAASAASFGLGTGLGWLLIHVGRLPTSFAYAGNAVVSLLTNFAVRKFVIFKG